MVCLQCIVCFCYNFSRIIFILSYSHVVYFRQWTFLYLYEIHKIQKGIWILASNHIILVEFYTISYIHALFWLCCIVSLFN